MYFLRSKKLARDLRNKYLRFRTAAFCEAKGATCFAAYYFLRVPKGVVVKLAVLASFCYHPSVIGSTAFYVVFHFFLLLPSLA